MGILLISIALLLNRMRILGLFIVDGVEMLVMFVLGCESRNYSRCETNAIHHIKQGYK